MSTLPVGFFKDFESLYFFSISYNKLISVPSGICKGRDRNSIRYLDLSNNNIKSLDDECFRDCWELEGIDLSNNSILTVHTKTFYGFRGLRSLSLHNNNLTTIPSDTFQGIFRLDFVSLGGNQLKCLPYSTRGIYVYTAKIDLRYKRLDGELLDLPICQEDDENAATTPEKIKPKFIQVNVQRFAYQKCIETRSWEMLANFYNNFRDHFSSGSLGDLSDDVFFSWACFRGHPCLSELGALSQDDAMCYVYNEIDDSWSPWGIKSEIGNQCVLGV
jgi:Leucine-rich repeat (LRR) protein